MAEANLQGAGLMAALQKINPGGTYASQQAQLQPKGYQPLSSLPALAASKGITPAPVSMGITATSPYTAPKPTNPVLKPGQANSSPLYGSSKASPSDLAPKVGTHVGNISNNPAFGPVGSVITREGLAKIAGQPVSSGWDFGGAAKATEQAGLIPAAAKGAEIAGRTAINYLMGPGTVGPATPLGAGQPAQNQTPQPVNTPPVSSNLPSGAGSAPITNNTTPTVNPWATLSAPMTPPPPAGNTFNPATGMYSSGNAPTGNEVPPPTTPQPYDQNKFATSEKTAMYDTQGQPSGFKMADGTITDMNGKPISQYTSQNMYQNASQYDMRSNLNNPSYLGLIQQSLAAQEKLKNFQDQYDTGLSKLTDQSIPLQFVQGQQGQFQRDYGAKLGRFTKEAEIAANLVQYGAPTSVSPGTALVSPITGQEQYSGIGGLVGLAKANQSIGQAQASQGAAFDLSQNLGILQKTGTQAVSLLQNSGLTLSDNPAVNQTAIETYLKQKDPATYTAYMAAAGELENTISGIIAGYTGQTPTAVSNTLESMSFKYLSPAQLQGFLQNVDQLGQIRLGQYQSGATAAYGAAQNKQPYTGTPATNGSLTPGAQIPQNQAMLGVGAGMINAIGGASGATAATIGGLFEKFFKL